MSLMSVLHEVRQERHRQDHKWGVQNHPDGTHVSNERAAEYRRALADRRAEQGRLTWTDILAEETCEAYAETDNDRLREELVQVAAVAVAWVEAIDRRKERVNA